MHLEYMAYMTHIRYFSAQTLAKSIQNFESATILFCIETTFVRLTHTHGESMAQGFH